MRTDKDKSKHKEQSPKQSEPNDSLKKIDRVMTILGAMIIVSIIIGLAYTVYLLNSSETSVIDIGKKYNNIKQNQEAQENKEEVNAQVLQKVKEDDNTYKLRLAFNMYRKEPDNGIRTKNDNREEATSQAKVQTLVEVTAEQYKSVNVGDNIIVYMSILNENEVEFYGIKER